MGLCNFKFSFKVVWPPQQNYAPNNATPPPSKQKFLTPLENTFLKFLTPSSWSRCMPCCSLLFFSFLRPDLLPWGYRNRCFVVPLCHQIVRSLNLEIAIKRREASVDKSTGVILVSCCTWKCVSTAYSAGVDISKVSGCYFS